ncbi:hypothetical protein BGZ65_001006 [Modicella reniformis]|uniref:G domain-containing protein n=1 Tax=Modicella reniformis TaxID=1440133 RepID=A0A9P6MIW4_9FUNG|nr:hypothetical protein BGZ65_001006 [Modicella reniformis]
MTSSASTAAFPVYNILLLGPSQSGKSSLLEAMKQYADPSYIISFDRIGNNAVSLTSKVCDVVVTTSLPEYKLYDLKDNGELNINRFIATNNERAFRKLLVRDEDLELRAEENHGTTKMQFRIFDTPGLEDTNGRDIQNIAMTFSALAETKEFHLVLITDSYHVPLLPSQEAAFKTYFEFFKDLRGLIRVVHTKVPDIHRHPGGTTIESNLSEKSKFFNRIAGGEVPANKIDCDLDDTGPVHVCLTRNTIRDILKIATTTTPLITQRANVHKSLMMIPVDKDVLQRCTKKRDSILKSCKDLNELSLHIKSTKASIAENKRLICEHDTDALLPLFQSRFDQAWSIPDRPGEITMKLPEQEYTIDKVDVDEQSTYVLYQAGGWGLKFWEVRFRRFVFKSGHYHVVLSITTRNKYRKEIERWKSELDILTRLLATQESEYELTCARRKLLTVYDKMIEHTSAKTVTLGMFMELAGAGLYQGTDVERCAKLLERHLGSTFGLDDD